MRYIASTLPVLFCFYSAFAQTSATTEVNVDMTSPVGFWKTIDDVSHDPRAIVEITQTDGKYFGHIVKTFPHEGDMPTCTECSGDKKDKAIIGLEIIWDIKKDDDEFNGGHILDPKNGKTYKAKLTLTEKGEKLKVRGFIGFSLLGRTQIWERTTAP